MCKTIIEMNEEGEYQIATEHRCDFCCAGIEAIEISAGAFGFKRNEGRIEVYCAQCCEAHDIITLAVQYHYAKCRFGDAYR